MGRLVMAAALSSYCARAMIAVSLPSMPLDSSPNPALQMGLDSGGEPSAMLLVDLAPSPLLSAPLPTCLLHAACVWSMLLSITVLTHLHGCSCRSAARCQVYFGVGLQTSCRLLAFWGVMCATNFFRCGLEGGRVRDKGKEGAGAGTAIAGPSGATENCQSDCPIVPHLKLSVGTVGPYQQLRPAPLLQLHSGPGACCYDPPPGSHHGSACKN